MHVTTIARKLCPRSRWMSAILNRMRLWKLAKLTLPEKLLEQGERSEAGKTKAAAWCRQHWEKEYAAAEKEAREQLTLQSIPDGADAERLLADILFCRFAYGFTADEFFAYELRGKSPETRRTYISDRSRNRLAIELNDFFDAGVFLDKYQTYLSYQDAFKREAILIQSDQDRQAFLQFVERHPVFVKKRVDLARGESVEIVAVDELPEERERVFREIRQSGRCILEEKIEQAAELAAFHPGSVNTVRCVVIWTKDRVEIPYCILRTGRGGSVIDNASAGGISAAIDPETGIVTTDGMDERNQRFAEHPDGHVVFKGYRMPEWTELLALVRDIAVRRDSIRYIGWDLACSTKGWCVVEGNYAPQLEARQVLCGGMRREFEAILGRAME